MGKDVSMEDKLKEFVGHGHTASGSCLRYTRYSGGLRSTRTDLTYFNKNESM